MKKWQYGLVGTFLVLGVFLIAAPFLKDYIIDLNVDKTMNEMNRLNSEDLKMNRAKGGKEETVNELPSEMDVFKSMNFKGDPVAFMYIPRTGLKLPIYGTVNNTNLLYGAGEMKDYEELGQGNYSIIGHRMKQEGLLFHDIPRLQHGDIVYVTDMERVFEYRVNDPSVIEESETEVIQDNGKDEITLLTCDIPSEPHNRVMVQGDLRMIYDYSEEIFN